MEGRGGEIKFIEQEKTKKKRRKDTLLVSQKQYTGRS